jgi:hypothetical protein
MSGRVARQKFHFDGFLGEEFRFVLGNFPPLSAAENSRPTLAGMPSVDLPAAAARIARRWASLTGGTVHLHVVAGAVEPEPAVQPMLDDRIQGN